LKFLGFWVSDRLFEAIEHYRRQHGFTRRSEFLRYAVRRLLEEERLEAEKE